MASDTRRERVRRIRTPRACGDTGPSSSTRCAGSPRRRRTSCTRTSTAISAMRCRDCCRFAPDRTACCRFPAEPRDADWHGWVDINQLPAVLNPPSGQIVTANNEVDRGLPYLVTRDWAAPFRAQRITELLGDRRGLDFRAMRQIQADITSVSADFILKAIELPESGEGASHVGSPRRRTARVSPVRSVRGGAVAADVRRRNVRRRCTIVFIVTPAGSESRVSTPSSAIHVRPGSTIAPRRT